MESGLRKNRARVLLPDCKKAEIVLFKQHHLYFSNVDLARHFSTLYGLDIRRNVIQSEYFKISSFCLRFDKSLHVTGCAT